MLKRVIENMLKMNEKIENHNREIGTKKKGTKKIQNQETQYVKKIFLF